LRNPVLEGASGSAIEGLLAGRPLIVADAGFYSDLPNDLVFKVPADIGLASLTAQLERLARDEGLRMHTGAAARLWAESHFNLEAYVLALEGLIHDTISANAVLSIGKNLGGELASLGLTAEDPAVERISAVLSEIFPT
ncbi:MAG TPA: glycosyl transferase family 1, partial [Phenylobacterium sp.]|nr:glycosyl transferase family 1 [Phenylobacterium sp.]